MRVSYVQLRNNERLGSDSSYKITVRQLESLVRLSEARARIDLCDEVTVEHVREAARLLNSSILKIHKPDMIVNTHGELVAEDNEKKTAPAATSSNSNRTAMVGN